LRDWSGARRRAYALSSAVTGKREETGINERREVLRYGERENKLTARKKNQRRVAFKTSSSVLGKPAPPPLGEKNRHKQKGATAVSLGESRIIYREKRTSYRRKGSQRANENESLF